MAARRTDNKGRILRDGESQRKNLLYQYRYSQGGSRKTIYASTLQELRAKEEEVSKSVEQGIDPSAGSETVESLVNRYLLLKPNLAPKTKETYRHFCNTIFATYLARERIGRIRVSDAKRWTIEMHQVHGLQAKTLASMISILRPAFQMAFEEDAIARNPFSFHLGSVLNTESKTKVALTPEQVSILIDFMRNDTISRRYFAEILILLETGVRVGELCGLTVTDLDFKNGVINVDHQLQRINGDLHIVDTKSVSSRRKIPMSKKACDVFQSLLSSREKHKSEMMIDGYTGFLFTTQSGIPKDPRAIRSNVKTVMDRFREKNPNVDFPPVTPHVFRHTFCSFYANRGMQIKTLQYIMGHSRASITLDVYSHVNHEQIGLEMSSLEKDPELGTNYKGKVGDKFSAVK